MVERPALFSGDEVRAILEGRKTQMRRTIRPQPLIGDRGGWYPKAPLQPFGGGRERHYAHETHMRRGLATDFSPYGAPGDRLWVRETWMRFSEEPTMCSIAGGPFKPTGESLPAGFGYRADLDKCGQVPIRCADGTICHRTPKGPWSSSTCMPRSASRIDLEITAVRVERLQDITQVNAVAEGCDWAAPHWPNPRDTPEHDEPNDGPTPSPEAGFARDNFARLWNHMNSNRATWASNPWVWVVVFKQVGVHNG